MLELLHGLHLIFDRADLSRAVADRLNLLHRDKLPDLRTSRLRKARTYSEASLSAVCYWTPRSKQGPHSVALLTSSPDSGGEAVSLALCTVLLPPLPTTLSNSHDHAC